MTELPEFDRVEINFVRVTRAANISVRWIKGHAGHVGNERADELAEIGRTSFAHVRAHAHGALHAREAEDLDAEYRAIMQEAS